MANTVSRPPQFMLIMFVSLVIIIFSIIVFYIFGEQKEKRRSDLFSNSTVSLDREDWNDNTINTNNGDKIRINDVKNKEIERIKHSPNIRTQFGKVNRDNKVENYTSNNEQVYNLASNIYTYNDAKAACMAHGGRLAKLEEVIDAYKNGANWCNYGWTDQQLALYPTQQDTFDKLQKGPVENRNDCGYVGVNGGYFQNPDLQFGANCYGTKPNVKPSERVKSNISDSNPLDNRVRYYKSKLHEIKVNPFNNDKWSSNQ